MIKLKKQYFLIVFSILIISCQNEDIPEESAKLVNRTIIVYMSADNDLSADALADIEEMKQGFSEKGTNLIVFIDLSDEPPYLLQIGNGTSWLPSGIALRSFGKDRGKEINILDLAKTLPLHFRFILFDACLMGAIEVVYEMHNCADYIIASSTETIADGFPYHLIIPELVKENVDLKNVAQQYFDYYNNQTGAYRSATVSVIKTVELEALAIEMRLIENFTINETFDRKAVQRLDVYTEQYHFDLLDYLNKAYPGANREKFAEQLNKAIIYKNHTPEFIGQYAINTYCGLSCYIPLPARQDLNNSYKTLQWYKAITPALLSEN